MDGPKEADDEDRVHPRVIIHIDMDYFYAQVEEVLNPSLKDKPFAVKQRFCVVTSNYIARQQGIKKLQPVKEALAMCPELVLINGEDITKYKEMSVRINEIMHRFTTHVEKLGLDENYLDVTELIAERLEQLEATGGSAEHSHLNYVEGLIHPPPDRSECAEVAPFRETDRDLFRRCCHCGCDRRLILATHLAKEIRDSIYKELGLRCCAGIAHNKLLAKLVGAVNKQNKQTVLLPTKGSIFVASLGSVRSLTGIGEKTAQTLADCCGISTVTDLQYVELGKLTKHLGYEQAVRLKQIAFGRDDTAVKQTGKPKSVGLEDSCPSISVRADAEEKFRHLLVRLVKNIAEDGRVPIAIKVTVRKYDVAKRTTHRESKQDKLLPSMFRHANGRLILADGAQDKILGIVMRVFERMVDLRQPFNITLLGLSFFKFQERRIGSKSIANFLIKKSDIEVQSITNLSNESITLSDISFCSNKSSLSAMDCEPCCSSDAGSIASQSGSESDVEPSPKKSRRVVLCCVPGTQERRYGNNSEPDETTLSKLRVADLRLNSKEYDQDHPSTAVSPGSPMDVSTQTGPSKMSSFFRERIATTSDQLPSRSTPVCIRSYDNMAGGSSKMEVTVSPSSNDIPRRDRVGSGRDQTQSKNHSKSTNLLPPNVDPEVFHALPDDVQQELLSNWRRANGGTVASSSAGLGPSKANSNPGSASSSSTHNNSTTNNSSSNNNNSTPANAAASGKGSTKNTLHRYFVKNT
ncbi:DNA polymerase iota [Anopheles marshallii]|uniref:DNA polymerase iota n=1 Tax=Anopheles marshallii TaxID=1521116 RepID=UPI00237BACF0|nr:DNA polymerase iota [Anopheles marshallii]